jgi:hypothetical protein
MFRLITICLLGVPLEHLIMYILNSIGPQALARASQPFVIRQRFTLISFALPLLARTLHLRSSVQAQLPTERAPLSPQRCLVNQKACWAASAAGLIISNDRAAWTRLLLRASNEHRFIVRVLRAREMSQVALFFPKK